MSSEVWSGCKCTLAEDENCWQEVYGEHLLDADDLSKLAQLFQSVREDLEVLIVLCSREVLQSSWCLVEITTAFMAKVPTVPLFFSDFTLPTEVYISHLIATPVRTENSLSIADVQRAVRCPAEFNEMVFQTLPIRS